MTMHLTLSLAAGGYHPAAHLPHMPNAAALQAITRAAEQAKLDAVLFGFPVAGRSTAMQLDPLPLLGSMIGITRQIGLIAGWTVDFTEPFHVARVFATLDHLSYGRTGWLAGMFETERLLPLIGKKREADDVSTYCARAGEFVGVVRALWDSWEDEGFALDKASGTFADPDRVHPLNHAGQFFSVRGPLNVPRPPQGTPPVVMQEPADAEARAFVARTADIVLSDHVGAGRRAELRTLAGGREQRVLANLLCVLDETEEAAQQRARRLDGLVPPVSSGARFVGTAAQLAIHCAEAFASGACEGFNLLPAELSLDVDPLLDVAVPQMQRDGLARAEYAGTTLRTHLGFSRPRSQFAEQAA